MALSRLTRWLHRRNHEPSDQAFSGNEYGWALREISGEARHPKRNASQPHAKRAGSDGERPAAP